MPEQEGQQEVQKQPEDKGQQNGNENTQTMTMEITAGFEHYGPLGKVDGKTSDELKAFFGTGAVSVTCSLKQ